ncbi:hypothetical protein L0222_27490 [bacterium]|nr:hypothetical protein [bacterium]
MPELRNVYAEKAISQIPRILSLQDRNSFSPSYGCMHRDYWFYKTSDFADAVRQFGVHALALVYSRDFPNNPYRNHPKIRDWALAAMKYWISIQHSDGSFDEFYPYERGWVGPTAFTTFTMVESLNLLRDEVPSELVQRLRVAISKAAQFIVSGEKEEDHLANHHAMACLAVWKSYRLLDDPSLEIGFPKLWRGFLQYHNKKEGWSREYDGIDPGYLSATVSFLGKIYAENPDPEIFEVLKQSVEFCSYFVYPNAFFAGSIGSRNTLHFYCHGFEILAGKIPMAAAIAEKMLKALSEGKLVPPEIMSDRYLFYRVPEFLQAYLDYAPRPESVPALPYERKETSYFPESRIYFSSREKESSVANLAKGGVVKVFERDSGRLILNDCGILGRLEDGTIVTSQWIDPSFQCHAENDNWEVSGSLNAVPSAKLFTPVKNLVFRAMLVALGWSSSFSHRLKGAIRKSLMLGRRPVNVQFKRRFEWNSNKISLSTEIWTTGGTQIQDLSVGDEFFVRYVPQSRFFQMQELHTQPYILTQDEIARLNRGERIVIRSEAGANS